MVERASLQPVPGFATAVRERDDDDFGIVEREQHDIRKTPEYEPAVLALPECVRTREQPIRAVQRRAPRGVPRTIRSLRPTLLPPSEAGAALGSLLAQARAKAPVRFAPRH
jgi:hypothetical protein